MLHLPKALNRVFAVAVVFVVLVMAAACPQPTPQGGEKVVTQVVEKQVVEPTIVVEETVPPASQDSNPKPPSTLMIPGTKLPLRPKECDGQNEAIQRELNEEIRKARSDQNPAVGFTFPQWPLLSSGNQGDVVLSAFVALRAEALSTRVSIPNSSQEVVGIVEVAGAKDSEPASPAATYAVAIDFKDGEAVQVKGSLYECGSGSLQPIPIPIEFLKFQPVWNPARSKEPPKNGTPDAPPPINVMIWSDGVCFLFPTNNAANAEVYCTTRDTAPQLSVATTFPTRYKKLQETIENAVKKMASQNVAPDDVLTDAVISEIEDPTHIGRCNDDGVCQEDIIGAPLKAAEKPTDTSGIDLKDGANPWVVGVVIVTQELTLTDRYRRQAGDVRSLVLVRQYVVRVPRGYHQGREGAPAANPSRPGDVCFPGYKGYELQYGCPGGGGGRTIQSVLCYQCLEAVRLLHVLAKRVSMTNVSLDPIPPLVQALKENTCLVYVGPLASEPEDGCIGPLGPSLLAFELARQLDLIGHLESYELPWVAQVYKDMRDDKALRSSVSALLRAERVRRLSADARTPLGRAAAV